MDTTTELPPLGMDADAVEYDLKRHFNLTLGREKSIASRYYLYTAVALTIRDRLVERWRLTEVCLRPAG